VREFVGGPTVQGSKEQRLKRKMGWQQLLLLTIDGGLSKDSL